PPCIARLSSRIRKPRLDGAGARRAAARHVGLPSRSAPVDGSDDLVPYHKRSDVCSLVRNESLQGENTAGHFDRPEDPEGSVFLTDPHHAQAHGSEQRLHYYVPHFAQRDECILAAFTHDRVWSRQSC